MSGGSPSDEDWGGPVVLFIILLFAGILLMIPTETVDFGYGATYTYQKYGSIAWTLIGMSWLPLLWPLYKHIYITMPRVYGQAIGEGIGRGMRKGKVCPECSTINDIDAKFCPECAYSWKAVTRNPRDDVSRTSSHADSLLTSRSEGLFECTTVCPGCHRNVPDEFSNCPRCGTAL